MKKSCMSMFAAAAVVTLNAATINQVIVRQQWPWSTKVKVEYSLSGVDALHPVDIAVTTYNGNDPLPSTNLRAAIEGDLYGITEEFGEFYIDPVVAYGTDKIGMTKFKVKLSVTDSTATEVLYKIFDLQTGSCRDVTRADFYNGKMGAYETDIKKIDSRFIPYMDDILVWTGITNDSAYATTKMVMRKIPGGGKTFTMGSPVGETGRNTDGRETQRQVQLAKDYYIGVYPLTLGQVKCFGTVDNAGAIWLTSNPTVKQKLFVTFTTLFADDPKDMCALPINNPTHVRGGNGATVSWPGDGHEVDGDSLLAKMRDRLGVTLDLPTEAQWEYACRAGSTAAFYSGMDSNLCAQDMGWYSVNSGNKVHMVGAKRPNAYGLYDMCGNVLEGCLDWFSNDLSSLGSVDVGGPASGTVRVMRGGLAKFDVWYLRSASRVDYNSGVHTGFAGARLVFEVE